MSLYARLGDEVGIRTAVDECYTRVVADPQLAHHVEDVDRDLAAGHAGLRITAPDFDRVVDHLVGTLTSLGVTQEDIGAVGAALTAHRDEIVPEPLAAS